MSDVFISHSSKDKPTVVRRMAALLRDMRLDVWVDEDSILCGDNLLDEIEKGIGDSLCIVLVLTPSFFESNWTSLELGIARGQKNNLSIIPVLVGITPEEVAKKYAFLMAHKYISVDKAGLTEAANEIYHTVEGIRAKRRNVEPLDYQEAVRKLNNFDTPSTNAISILISEYADICKVSMSLGIAQATKIGDMIIGDIYLRARRASDSLEISWRDKLKILKDLNVGLNYNVIEHLNALMTMPAIHLFSNELDKKRLVDLSLAAALNWYTSYISLKVWKEDDFFEVVSPGELTYQDFVDMYEIDKMVLRPDLIAPPDITYKWYNFNIFTHIAVRSANTRKIVGYFAILPITDELFERIQSGDFKDNDLSTDGIRQYDMADFYKLYVAAVCVHPAYQNTLAFNRLYHALINMMYKLATEREVYITDIITEASTKRGEKLCHILGLRKLMDTRIDTELYTATLLPPSFQLRNLFGSKLIKFYQNKYDDMKDLL